jgi:hypothetical protein
MPISKAPHGLSIARRLTMRRIVHRFLLLNAKLLTTGSVTHVFAVTLLCDKQEGRIASESVAATASGLCGLFPHHYSELYELIVANPRRNFAAVTVKEGAEIHYIVVPIPCSIEVEGA